MSSSSSLRTQLILQLLLTDFFAVYSLFIDYPSADLPSSWLNTPSTAKGNWKFSDNTSIRPILALGKNDFPNFCFGFFNNGTANTFFLAILKIPNKVDSNFSTYNFPPVVVWSANGNSPVKENATLDLTDSGLILKDSNGVPVWVGGTSGLFRLELGFNGNLRLFNEQNLTIWESFQEPTNTWLPGQQLLPNQNLKSSISTYDLGKGLFSLRLSNDSIECYVDSNPGQRYCSLLTIPYHTSFPFGLGSLNRSGEAVTYYASPQYFQYLRLQPNGSLNVFLFIDNKETFYFDLLYDQRVGDCDYPVVCGRYGVCNETKCSCAGESNGSTTFFRQVNASQANLGCQPVNQISCVDVKNHGFLELSNVNYFSFPRRFSNVDASGCRNRCLRDCSCKAYRYRDDVSKGKCSFTTEVFSLKATSNEDKLPYTAVTYVKVQIPIAKNGKSSSISRVVLLLTVLASGIVLLSLGACCCYVARRKNRAILMESEGEKSTIDIPPVVRRFSFENLKAIADDFRVQLGKGGYGEVFEGTLENGTKVAVKRLFDKGKTEFLPEVKTIGRVHHFNLVRLVGYCAEGSNRLLVYEYMDKGSLDKWIFNQNRERNLSWELKWRIILGIAKGLEYLHEHCNPKILHFDIKPQNILLDEEFNVKIADFGLAKWIDRDQSNVSTLVKGTRGYMAPELIAGKNVSVKVDVYSFGIVILEIIFGHKNTNVYQNEEYLMDEIKRMAEEGRLVELIDNCNEDLKANRSAAVKAVEIGIRCLQPHNIRPSIPVVVKLLEGMIDVEPILDYAFLSMFYDPCYPKMVYHRTSTHVVDSVLSEPR
ncbi:Serine/threonine protein kinase [Handroanthus impetiginosus]|uniref:Receptor-like serine/threonine-protein kinase n=1 Tax=Handroanthus impetiginosus TaxID=429701 RepID=A0A2G9H3N1_9LAMI|nr:Serine/threonine protein kinase [Handroanthus impetiginosus]